jgi:hypothetical protein
LEALLVGSVFYLLLVLRDMGRTLVIDDESIRMMRGTRALWTLPWNQYGGYKALWPSMTRGMVTPIRVEFLNGDGRAAGQARLLKGFTSSEILKVYPLAELLANRAPAGGVLPKVRPTPNPNVIISLLVAFIAASMVAFWLTTSRIEKSMPHHGSSDATLPIYPGLIMLGIMGILGLVMVVTFIRRKAKRGERPGGVSALEVALNNGLPPMALEAGKRYRYMEVTELRDSLDVTSLQTWGMAPFFVGMHLYLIYFVFDQPHTNVFSLSFLAPALAFIVGMTLIIGIVFARRLMAIDRLRKSLDDQFEVVADKLEVNHGGKVVSFPLQSKEKDGPTAVLFGSRVLQFRSATSRYWLDPRFLQEI